MKEKIPILECFGKMLRFLVAVFCTLIFSECSSKSVLGSLTLKSIVTNIEEHLHNPLLTSRPICSYKRYLEALYRKADVQTLLKNETYFEKKLDKELTKAAIILRVPKTSRANQKIAKVIKKGRLNALQFNVCLEKKKLDNSCAENQCKKNSLHYNGPTHVYEIIKMETKTVYKVGESSQELTKNGLSKRAEQQVRKLRRETGQEFKTRIVEWHGGKRNARIAETKRILAYRQKDPKALPGNKGIH
jgi:hypothetical protein